MWFHAPLSHPILPNNSLLSLGRCTPLVVLPTFLYMLLGLLFRAIKLIDSTPTSSSNGGRSRGWLLVETFLCERDCKWLFSPSSSISSSSDSSSSLRESSASPPFSTFKATRMIIPNHISRITCSVNSVARKAHLMPLFQQTRPCGSLKGWTR